MGRVKVRVRGVGRVKVRVRVEVRVRVKDRGREGRGKSWGVSSRQAGSSPSHNLPEHLLSGWRLHMLGQR